MIFVINEQNPQRRLVQKARDILEQGGVIIYPTDTVYAYGCDINDKRAIERIYRIKKIAKNKPLSFIFCDIADIHEYQPGQKLGIEVGRLLGHPLPVLGNFFNLLGSSGIN